MAEEDKQSNIELKFKGYLKGHNGNVTCIQYAEQDENRFLVSGSRDKTLMLWKLNDLSQNDISDVAGKPFKSLTGNTHYIQDLCLSSNSSHCITASWDHTLRLWDLNAMKSKITYIGEKKDILTVTFSKDNKQIISGGMSKTICYWNTEGELKYSKESAHDDWISSIKVSPSKDSDLFFTTGWDGRVKVWDKNTVEEKNPNQENTKLSSPIYCSDIDNKGAFLAVGEKEGKVKIFGIMKDTSTLKLLREADFKEPIYSLKFHPESNIIMIGTESGFSVYNYQFSQFGEKTILNEEEKVEEENNENPKDNKGKKIRQHMKIGVSSMTLNQKGTLLFTGSQIIILESMKS